MLLQLMIILAKRDCENMGKIFKFLGVSVDILIQVKRRMKEEKIILVILLMQQTVN